MKRIVKSIKFSSSTYSGNWTNQNTKVSNSILYDAGNTILENFKKEMIVPEEKVFLEYIWHDKDMGLRSKSRVIDCAPEEPLVIGENIKNWSYDGSSTGQLNGGNSDALLIPVNTFPDPFRGGRNLLVLCEGFDENGNPLESNHRAEASIVFGEEEVKEHDLIFAFEQEYVLLFNNKPIGWPEDGNWPENFQGQYYCSVGNENAVGRNFVEAHALACMHAGLEFGGINAEVMLGSWEYQIGPCDGITIGDQLEISRYLLYRIGEMMNLNICLHPKPIVEESPLGGWNGSGNHCNCSSKEMREEGGIEAILDAVKKLSKKHSSHQEVYGKENNLRLSGNFETQHYDKFSSGVADRGSSIRIQRSVFENKKGWFEDRRPGSNCNPYQVTSRIAKTLYDIDDFEVKMKLAGFEI